MTSNTTPSFGAQTPASTPRVSGTWREQLLNGILRSGVALGAVALLFGSIDTVRRGSSVALICYVAAYIALLYVAFTRNLRFSLRAGTLIFLLYVLGVIDLFQEGLSGDGASFLFMSIFLTAIFLDRSRSIIALVGSLLTYTAAAWALVTGTVIISTTEDASTSATAWLSSGTVFLLLSVVLIVSLSFLISSLERSLSDVQQERIFVATVLDTAGALVMVLDPNGRIIRFNRACEQTAGLSFEQVRGQHFHHLPVAPKDSIAFREQIGQLRSGHAVGKHEHHWMTPDGAECLIAWSNTVLFDGEGAVAYLVCTGIDITEQRRAETERSQLQEAIIQSQASTLQDMSTPLIPISDGVVVMPLIGAIDRARTQQVVQTLLHGVEARRTRIAIIDITGVAVVDAEVANTLLQVARATRLLGAQVILTGIRPEAAQAIVGLGVDLNAIVTRSTLQSGITYALRQEHTLHDIRK